MYTIQLDEKTGIAKVMENTNNGQKLFASFSTIQDFCNAMAINAKMETPILPPSCFKYSSGQDGMHLMLFYPARDIKFEIRSGYGSGSYDLHIPNTVIKASLALPFNGKTQMNQGFIYFTDSMLPVDNMKLYKPPFPNVYEDGRICFGSVIRGTYDPANLFGIDAVYHMFFGNTANGDLWRGEYIGTKLYKNPIEFLNDLAKLNKDEQMKVYFDKHKFKTMFTSAII